MKKQTEVRHFTISTDEQTTVLVGNGLLPTIVSILQPYSYSHIAILVDETTDKLFLPIVKQALDHASIPSSVIRIANGETSKNFDTLQTILSSLTTHTLDRKSAIIALGGGVVGDIATLAAGLYYRGIDCIQIPTTLLSQVDSALGGKGAIDLGTHKNTIGIIKQPRLVLVDTQTLTSLPSDQITSGMGEIIKYAIAMDPTLFTLLSENDYKKNLDEIIARCITLKMETIQKDPKDITGARAVLNFGHTLGQAIELQTKFSHGQAVAVGCAFAIKLSQKLQMITELDAEKALSLLKQYNLPLTITGLDKEEVLRHMKKDKKSINGIIKFVLLEGLGKAKMNCIVDDAVVMETLSEIVV